MNRLRSVVVGTPIWFQALVLGAIVAMLAATNAALVGAPRVTVVLVFAVCLVATWILAMTGTAVANRLKGQ